MDIRQCESNIKSGLQTVNRIDAATDPFHLAFFTGTVNDIADLLFVESGFSSQCFNGNPLFKTLHNRDDLIGGCHAF